MTLTASEVASLKSALGCWEWAEYISTGVVFSGCVGEFFAEFTRFPTEEKKKRKMARLSLILVIAGIAGELLATVRASQLSGLVIANVEAQAGDAKRSAESAANAADRADTSAGIAKDRAEQIGKEADLLRKEAEHERLARVQLEAETIPKYLTEKEEQEITDTCRPFGKPSIKVLIETSPGYGFEVGSQIEASLRKAGFTVDFRRTEQVWYGAIMGGPIDHWDAVIAVVGAISKPLSFFGIIWELPPGSPIRLQIGEKLIRPLSKPTATSKAKAHLQNQ